MSLTSAQIAKVKFYLGYPQTNQYDSYLLTSVLQAIDDADVETLITSCLTELADVDNRLSTFARGIAGITAVGTGDPEFAAGQALKDLRSAGKEQVKRLSSIINFQPLSDVFSGSSSSWNVPIAMFG